MAKKLHNDVFDAALAEVATATTLVFTSAEPADYAGIAAVTLVTAPALTPGLGGVSFTAAADGITSGRRVTVAAQTGMTPSADGTVTHACLHDGVTLLAATTTTSQAVTTTQTWDSPAFDIELQDPA